MFEFEDIDQTMCGVRIEPMKFLLRPKEKKRIDLFIEPVRTGEWVQEIKWKYYDDFKMNPQNYPHLANLTFNKDYDNDSANFVRT